MTEPAKPWAASIDTLRTEVKAAGNEQMVLVAEKRHEPCQERAVTSSSDAAHRTGMPSSYPALPRICRRNSRSRGVLFVRLAGQSSSKGTRFACSRRIGASDDGCTPERYGD